MMPTVAFQKVIHDLVKFEEKPTFSVFRSKEKYLLLSATDPRHEQHL